MREIIAGTIAITILIAAAAGATYATQSYSCHSQWGRSGMAVEFGLVEGCLIKTAQGWIPADHYKAAAIQ